MKANDFYEKAYSLNNKICEIIKKNDFSFNYELIHSFKEIENQLKEISKKNIKSFDFIIIIEKNKLIDLYLKEFISELDSEIDYIPSREEIIKDFEEANPFNSEYYILICEAYNMYSRNKLDFDVFWNFDNLKIPAEVFGIDWQFGLIIKPDYNIQKVYLIK